jgi:prepilin-type N-terminal cleavage/methylation domain-containing protein
MRLAQRLVGMHSARKSARRREGYTLVELMMVVTIIGASVLAFAPGISRAAADRHVSTAARELIRLGRRARAESFGYLRAHLLWITPATGRVQLLRAPTNSCRFAQWQTIQADCTAVPVGPRCLEDFRIGSWGSGSTPIQLHEETGTGGEVSYGTGQRGLCYEPSGIVWYGTEELEKLAANLSSTNAATINGGFVYTLHRGTEKPDTKVDRVHRVLFPLGASPRAWR